MLRIFLAAPALFLSAALANAALAAGQTPAQARLFTRSADGVVRAAIQIELEGAWHLYHKELGHPKAIGQPTTVTFYGDGIEWGEVRFPEPVRLDQSSIGGEGTFILAHEHTLVLYAAGKLAEGAAHGSEGPGSEGDGLEVKVKGLVCEDTQGCIPYRQTMKSEGRGEDALFAAFPADLLAAAASVPVDQEPDAPEVNEFQIGLGSLGGEEEHARATLHTRVTGSEVRAALEIELDEGWHLYHTAEDLGQKAIGKPTRLTFSGEGITWEAPRFPKPKRIDQSELSGAGAYINAHEGTLVVYARGTLASGASGAGRAVAIRGQICDPSVCLDYSDTAADRGPGTEELWEGWDAAFTAALPDPEPPPDAARPEEKGLLSFLLLAVAGGLFALVMPCTYPMIPITISFFTKQAEKRGGNALSLSLAYGAGIVLIFVLIGVTFGSLIIPFATHPVTNLVIGLAFVYFALVLFGVLNLQPPAALMNLAGTASMKGGYAGVFLMGATLVVTSFTCTAPFVGSLLSIGAGGGDMARIALGMGVFGLTMAVPFVVLSLVPGRIRAIPRSGEWMNTLKVFFGFVELAAALKFLSNADRVWDWQLLSREVFLLLWGLLFVAAALYLFGLFTRGTRIGPRRMAGAALTFAFALYCFWGMSGRSLDFVMTAFAPPYSGGRVGWKWFDAGENWPIVKDDYDAAAELARKDGKLLLVNFTGLTCANCISNELHVFPKPEVAKILRDSFVEARLHTDGESNIERILELQKQLARSVATPLYLVQDPRTSRQLGESLGGLTSVNSFSSFLRRAVEAKERVGRLDAR